MNYFNFTFKWIEQFFHNSPPTDSANMWQIVDNEQICYENKLVHNPYHIP